MPRSTFTLTEPNAKWLDEQLESREWSSKAEVINALIREKRKVAEAQLIALLEEAQGSPIREWTRDELLAHLRSTSSRSKVA